MQCRLARRNRQGQSPQLRRIVWGPNAVNRAAVDRWPQKLDRQLVSDPDILVASDEREHHRLAQGHDAFERVEHGVGSSHNDPAQQGALVGDAEGSAGGNLVPEAEGARGGGRS